MAEVATKLRALSEAVVFLNHFRARETERSTLIPAKGSSLLAGQPLRSLR